MEKLASILILLSSVADETEGWLPRDLLDTSGFVVTRVSTPALNQRGVGFSTAASRQVDGRANLVFMGASFMSRRNDLVSQTSVPTPLETMSQRTPSGIPLGADSRWFLSGGVFGVLFATRFEEGSSHIQRQGSDENGFYKPPAHDWTADQQLLERFLRYSLARIAGRRLGSVTTGTLAGASIPTATCERSNAKYGDLRAWCSAKNWTVTENKDLGVLTVKRGSTFAVVPMGTAWVKWDGATWTKMSDVVMEKDGRVMAPKDVLDRLNSL